MATGTQPQDQTRLKLEASLPNWCALDWRQSVVCAAFVLLFMWLAYLPVGSTATWTSIVQGEFANTQLLEGSMAEVGRMPFSQGIRSFRVGSIGSWVIWKAYTIGGAELLSLGFAMIQTLAGVLWAWLLFRTSRRWWTGILVPCILLTPWQSSGMSPACFGLLCMGGLLICLTWNRNQDSHSIQVIQFSKAQWLAIAFVMLAWTNLDSSFVFGWAFLAVLLLGQLIGCVIERKNAFTDSELKSRLILLEIAIAVSIVNPQGWELWKALLWMPDHPIGLQLGGWQPLLLSGWIGFSVVAIGIFWFACSRTTRTIEPVNWLLPTTAIVALCFNTSAIAMLALPVIWASVSMLPRKAPTPATAVTLDEEPAPLRFGFTLFSALLVWLGFAFSPFAHHALGGQGRSDEQRLGKSSPHASLEFLGSHLQETKIKPLVWCPRQWSDQVLLDCEHSQIFATSQPYLVPDQVNADYQTIYSGQHGWRKLLDRYTVDIVVVDAKRQERLMHNMRAKPGDWQRIYEDPVAIIWQRRRSK